MPSIHQLVAGYAKSDAISNEARVLRDMFRRWGFASDIYCETRRILPELRGDARDLAGLRCAPEDIALLHLSIGSPANDLFQVLPCRRVLLYHNITPSSFFRLINQSTAANLELGRRQACALSGAAHIVLADSAFNAAELREMGYGDVSVFPLALELESLDRTSPGMLRALADGRTNVLFVGRGAPNKKIEDVITAFAFFQRFVDPDARLVHAGSYAGTERYAAYVRAAAREAGIGNVLFTGSIPQEELNACYAAASVFVCMSEHEGFCIPLLEAMKAGVPVLAFEAGAVPETMDGAGVIFRKKDFAAVAEMMGLLAGETPLRRSVLRGQCERVARFTARDAESELRNLLAPTLPRLDNTTRHE
ncbi:MAG: glycosyltransferase [Lentisphaerae bacterium]|nr:glycosyltransferase [Lentisphaerota bacterium]